MKITNNSKAPQGVQTASGPRYIKPSATVDVELTKEGLLLAKRLPFLTIEKPPAAEKPAGEEKKA